MENVFDSVGELSRRLHNREISAVELARGYLERIEAKKNLNAFLDVRPEETLKQAEAADARLSAGTAGPLTGIPIAHKDIFVTKEWSSTAASRMLKGYMSPFDATVVRQLKSAGMVCLGKLNCDEFAMGSSNENSAFKKVHNPWDLKKVPGGSSGGSAASVSACEATLALGSDTGGSIRLPASFCGIVGMKPTYGRVSRYGLIAFASSLDQIGPFARTVEDAANLLEVISGHDPKDSTSLNLPVEHYAAHLNDDIKGMKVGVIKELMAEGLSADVQKAMEKAIEDYKKLGAEVVEISLPNLKHSIGIYYILATAECSSNLARFDGVKYGYRTPDAKNLMEMYTKTRAEGFGPEVKRRIMLGTYALSSGYYDAYYKKAQQMRALVTQDFVEAFKKVDILISPTCPNTAFEIGAKSSDPLQMYLTDIATISANLAGIPGMSVPAGFDKDGMPIGLQILAPQLQESRLFNAAHKFERANDYYLQLANI